MARLKNLEAIIFDLGEVIVDLDPQAVINEFSRLTGADGYQVRDLIVSSPYLYEYETGQLNDQEFVDAVNDLFKTNVTLTEFKYAWNLMIKAVTRERLEFMKTLMKTHQVFILSNTNRMHELHFDQMVAKLTDGKLMKDHVHTAHYSHDIGYRKPEARIYQHVIDQHNLNPEKTIFLDDRLDNVESALKVGLKAQQVQFPDQIFEILKDE